MRTEIKHKLFMAAAAILIAFLFLMICSKNSFLYPMNDWGDVNCFMTMGRSILNGKVMYVDIYEQKGPLLYFIYAVAAAISSSSFAGVFIVELICFSAFLYAAAKTAELIIGKRSLPASLAIMTVSAFAGVVSASFAHGGSVEEMQLFMLTWTLYFAMDSVKNGYAFGSKRSFVVGIFAAASLWIKYTACGFYLGLGIFLFVFCLTDKNRRHSIVGDFLSFSAGAAAMTAPIIVYFAANHALGDLYTAYFYNNIFLYGGAETHGVSGMIAILGRLAKGLGRIAYHNLPAAPFFAAAAIYFLTHIKKKLVEGLLILCCGAFLWLSSYFGRYVFVYYAHSFIAFLPACAALMLKEADAAAVRKGVVLKKASLYTALVLIPVLLAGAFLLSSNTYLMHTKREDMPQYKFAEKIGSVANATLLDYRELDSGFYFASGIIPSCKFFCTLNIPLQEMYDETRQAILDGKIDFIVSPKDLESMFAEEEFDYVLDDSAEYRFEGLDLVYRLYRRADLG